MTKIVHFGKYYPPDMGGIEVVTRSLVVAANDVGYDVVVVCFDQSGADSKDDSGVHIQRYPIQKIFSSQPLSFDYFFSVIREGRKADIIHLHAPNFLAALACLFLGTKPKLLIHWHSDVVGKGMLGRLVRPLEYLMLKRAKVILVTSQRYADSSPSLWRFSNKISVVPLGVAPPEEVQEPKKLTPRLAEFIAGKKLVLSVGRLTAYKGFTVLIEAIKYMPDEAVVVIAGTGELFDKLFLLVCRNKLHNKVFLAGHVTQEELIVLYKKASLFCLPSIARSEAFGIAIIEAMAYGVPIVATDIEGSGVPWVNAHRVSGLNVPPNNVKELAAACALILNCADLRNKYSDGAKERYAAQFTERVFQKKILAIYEYLGGQLEGL